MTFVTRVCNNTLPGATPTYFEFGTVTKLYVTYTVLVSGIAASFIVYTHDVATGSQPCFLLLHAAESFLRS
jgi:hypothetical protein